jgi:hypothetical protein
MSQALMSDRAIIADNIFEQCILPKGMVIESFSGWETMHGPAVETTVNVWKRDVYLENTEDDGGPTFHALFQIWFYPNSVQVKEVMIGNDTIKVPAP